MTLRAYYHGTMEVSVPTRFMRDWIHSHYAERISEMCTEENEEVIYQFLKKRDDFVIQEDYGGLPDEICKIAVMNGFFKTFPYITEMDGFFSVRLQRIR